MHSTAPEAIPKYQPKSSLDLLLNLANAANEVGGWGFAWGDGQEFEGGGGIVGAKN